MITHIGGSECYNHIMLHTHQTQVPPQSCWNGGLPEKIIKYHNITCWHSGHLRKKYSVTHWVITLRIRKVLFAHRVTSPWVPLQLVPLVLYCSPAFEQNYHLYGFYYQDHNHHCHDCFQHDHLLHISLHFHFHPPMSCFCLDHLLLWRLGRSWWLSLAISRIICFHCLQDFSLIMACLLSQFYQRNIHFLSNAILCSPEMGG